VNNMVKSLSERQQTRFTFDLGYRECIKREIIYDHALLCGIRQSEKPATSGHDE
jgi:hypothetical protein